jgi:flagellar hook assembly protein FlgD
VALTVYDLTGQTVATLVEGERDAGAYEIRWDGRNSAGRDVASGVYLYRLWSSDGQVLTHKMALVR